MENYNVTGMTCAACVAHVEKAVKAVPGVEEVNVSLLTNSMSVRGTADSSVICKAVDDAGYHAEPKHKAESQETSAGMTEDDLADKETPAMVRRLILSLAFLLPIMYLSMGHSMLGWPLPAFLHDNHVGIGITEMLLAIIVMFINRKFFISGVKSSLHLSPNMDTLVALGSGVSFIYSLAVLYDETYQMVLGNMEQVMADAHNLYFESAAMIVTLITIGKTLEAYSKGKTTNALKGLLKLAPKTATLLVNGTETVVDATSVVPGDIFVVRPGESIPVDGEIIDGESAVNESALTGESVPVDKITGDQVYVGTLNTSGFITCKATKVGEDTTLASVIRMVSDAAATKAPIAKTADKVAGVFVPVVLVIALVTFIVWMLVGADFTFALNHAIAVLVISCPCALGLATPVAIMVGNGVGAGNGVLFKTAAALEEAGRSTIVIMDKTGTITKGEPQVTEILPADGVDAKTLLTTAVSLEAKSEHPLAMAITEYAKAKEIIASQTTGFENLSGSGIHAFIDDQEAYAGKGEFVQRLLAQNKKADSYENFNQKNKIDDIKNEGKTPLYFVRNGELLGVIAVADTIKPESAEAIRQLKEMGLTTVMLTGDNEQTAAAIGSVAGVDKVIAGVMPDGKEEVIRTFQQDGKVIMVGDGINDAPALTRANVGFAIGAGTDIAIDAADVVLVNSKLTDVPAAIRLSKYVLRNIKENLFWAFFYNVIGIPLAAGVYYSLNGWTLSPMFGAAAMSLSSFCVCMNALRLNLIDVHKSGRFISKHKNHETVVTSVGSEQDNTANNTNNNEVNKEKSDMEKIFNVEGMMCNNCERHVKNAIEAIDGVESAVANHEDGTVKVEFSKEVPTEQIAKAVEEEGYHFKD